MDPHSSGGFPSQQGDMSTRVVTGLVPSGHHGHGDPLLKSQSSAVRHGGGGGGGGVTATSGTCTSLWTEWISGSRSQNHFSFYSHKFLSTDALTPWVISLMGYTQPAFQLWSCYFFKYYSNKISTTESYRNK